MSDIIVDGYEYDYEDIFYCLNCFHFVEDDDYRGSYCRFKINGIDEYQKKCPDADSTICENFTLTGELK